MGSENFVTSYSFDLLWNHLAIKWSGPLSVVYAFGEIHLYVFLNLPVMIFRKLKILVRNKAFQTTARGAYCRIAVVLYGSLRNMDWIVMTATTLRFIIMTLQTAIPYHQVGILHYWKISMGWSGSRRLQTDFIHLIPSLKNLPDIITSLAILIH